MTHRMDILCPTCDRLGHNVMARSVLRKVIDDEAVVRCAAGAGFLREEVWEDVSGKVVRYNLAFINQFIWNGDNGRVLGYDNSHRHHHRHFKGRSEPVAFVSYADVRDRFIAEVAVLKKEKP